MKYLVFIFCLSIWHLPAQTRQKSASVDTYFYDAMTERLKANYKSSNELFEQCLTIDDHNDAIYFKMAQNYFDLKDYDNSLTYLNKALSLNPKNKWYQKLFIEIKIKQKSDKKTVYKLIENYKALAANKYIINDLYRQFKRQSFKAPTQKTKIPQKNLESDTKLKQLFETQQYQKLEQLAEKVLNHSPDYVPAYLYMAKAKTALKKYTEALDYLDMGIDFIMKNKDLRKSFYRQYILIYAAQNNLHKADFYKQKLQKI